MATKLHHRNKSKSWGGSGGIGIIYQGQKLKGADKTKLSISESTIVATTRNKDE